MIELLERAKLLSNPVGRVVNYSLRNEDLEHTIGLN